MPLRPSQRQARAESSVLLPHHPDAGKQSCCVDGSGHAQAPLPSPPPNWPRTRNLRPCLPTHPQNRSSKHPGTRRLRRGSQGLPGEQAGLCPREPLPCPQKWMETWGPGKGRTCCGAPTPALTASQSPAGVLGHPGSHYLWSLWFCSHPQLTPKGCWAGSGRGETESAHGVLQHQHVKLGTGWSHPWTPQGFRSLSLSPVPHPHCLEWQRQAC